MSHKRTKRTSYFVKYKKMKIYKMKTTIKARCWLCDKFFLIRDGREWKYLCSKCFNYLYKIVGVKERPLELRNNWLSIMRKLCAEKAQYFPPAIKERFRDQGILN